MKKTTPFKGRAKKAFPIKGFAVVSYDKTLGETFEEFFHYKDSAERWAEKNLNDEFTHVIVPVTISYGHTETVENK